jgi:hypothetical protein
MQAGHKGFAMADFGLVSRFAATAKTTTMTTTMTTAIATARRGFATPRSRDLPRADATALATAIETL